MRSRGRDEGGAAPCADRFGPLELGFQGRVLVRLIVLLDCLLVLALREELVPLLLPWAGNWNRTRAASFPREPPSISCVRRSSRSSSRGHVHPRVACGIGEHASK